MTRQPSARFGLKRGIQRSALSTMRPMRTGELIDRAMRVFQRHGLLLLRTCAFAALLYVAAFAVLDSFVFPAVFTAKTGATQGEQVASSAMGMALALFVGGPLFVIGSAWIAAICAYVTIETLSGREVNEDVVIAHARDGLMRHVSGLTRSIFVSGSVLIGSCGLILLAAAAGDDQSSASGAFGILGIVGVIAGLIVNLFLRCRHALLNAVLTAEPQVSPKDSLRRSGKLLGSNRYHVHGLEGITNGGALMYLVGALFLGSIGSASALIDSKSMLDSLIGAGPVRSILQTIVDVAPVFCVVWVLMPAWHCILTVIYFDRRIRLEALDIETLAGFAASSGGRSNA